MLLLFDAQFLVITIGLLVVAVRQGNRRLGAWALAFGVIAFPEGFFFWSNRLYDLTDALGLYASTDGYFRGAHGFVTALLGLVLITGGLLALRHEHAVRA